MKLSVAYSFQPGLIEKIAQFKEVYEIFGKLDKDFIGGGRSAYTLRKVTKGMVKQAVKQAHKAKISFNYLLNGATLQGIEQTRSGQKKIRAMLDFLSDAGVDSLTVASPYLLRLIKRQYPHFLVRASAFAVIDNPHKALQWEDMGADTLCVSAIACNRDFSMLAAIRQAVRCDLQLIANACCLLNCSHELTHMNMLTRSSRSGDPLGGFCLDYCFLNCSRARISDPVNYIRSTWIRPEDLEEYEKLGYTNFKILERSCSPEILLKRVAAYVNRHFEGNLYALVNPVAQLSAKGGASLAQRIRLVLTMARPEKVKVRSLLAMKGYAKRIIEQDFFSTSAPVYIDNTRLNGFIRGLRKRNCARLLCETCRYCHEWADRTVTVDPTYRAETLQQARDLDEGLVTGRHWF